MKEYIEKADVLIEALPYIQRFRGETIVIKFGGSAMEDPAHVEGVMADVTFMECVGMRPVLVHGGGKEISRGMKEKGIEPRFVGGLRVTCERTIEVVERVLNEVINPRIVALLKEQGARAVGMRGERILRVVRRKDTNARTGEELDYGFVGDPVGVDVDAVRAVLETDSVPVITPLGRGPDGKVYNVNADAAASAVAKALKARKLAFLSDVPGLLRNPEDSESLIATLRVGEVEYLVEKGVIDGGMLPKVRGGVDALQAGVGKIHMIDGRLPHSLLLEIFTDKGVGTEIVSDD